MVDPKDAKRAKRRAKAMERELRDAAAAARKQAASQRRAADDRAVSAASRPRHSKPDFEKLLQLAEQNGWQVTRDGGYYKCRCRCGDKHYVSVVLTPSSSRTLANTRAEFERASCWQ
jgi:hypothetical protein